MIPIPRQFVLMSGAAVGVAAVGIVAFTALERAPSPVASAPAPLLAAAPAERQAPPASSSRPLPVAPSFDVVRVEPTGEAVIAGRAEPNATVQLLNRGQPIAEAKADGDGQFVILPPPLKPGDHELSLSANGSAGATPSNQSVTMIVPNGAGDKVVAALMAPDQPTRVLADAAPAASMAGVSIRVVEAGEGGSFSASGFASPGSTVRIYLNNASIASVVAAKNGEWSLRVGRGVKPGQYDVRADVVDPETGKVLSRAEAPFEFPEAKRVAGPPAPTATVSTQQAAASGAPATSQPVASGDVQAPGHVDVEQVQSVMVARGDSLWRISRRILGRGIRYTQIYEANAAQIRDPDRIWPGQIFVAPKM